MPTVFEHVVEAGKIFVYLSDYDSYVMEPWVEVAINAAELWTVKGVADYLATQSAPDVSAVEPVIRKMPENMVIAMAAATESGQGQHADNGGESKNAGRPFNPMGDKQV
jgi:uncharacterized FlgJ-related protein